MKDSLSARCRNDGVNYIMVYNRLRKGLSYHQAVEAVREEMKKDKSFESYVYAFCKKHKLNYDTIIARIRRKHFTLEQAIDENFVYETKHAHTITYKGKGYSIRNGCAKFLADHNITVSAPSSLKVLPGETKQDAFERYCKKMLDKYNRI